MALHLTVKKRRTTSDC